MLEGKVAIVTGASRGIGLAIARSLAEKGVTVYAGIRTKTGNALPEPLIPLIADVRSREEVTHALGRVLSESERIDILVNNAGVEVISSVEDTDDTTYDTVLDTNLKGAFICTTAVLPIMKTQRDGHLLFINSLSGLRGYAEDAVYCASKHGLAGFADALQEELREYGIRVSSIYPGATDTEFSHDSWSAPDDPRRRFFLHAEDIAAAVTFAVSQPRRVVIPRLVLQPFIERPYSDFLDVGQVAELLNDG